MEKKPHRKNRNQAFVRHQRQRAIAKKSWIYSVAWLNNDLNPRRKGKFAKGKVHCSCSSCSPKSKFWGFKEREKSRRNAMKHEAERYARFGED